LGHASTANFYFYTNLQSEKKQSKPFILKKSKVYFFARSLPGHFDIQQRPIDGHPVGLFQGVQCGSSSGWMVVLLHLLLLRAARLREEEETDCQPIATRR